jgi:hypothetical protein
MYPGISLEGLRKSFQNPQPGYLVTHLKFSAANFRIQVYSVAAEAKIFGVADMKQSCWKYCNEDVNARSETSVWQLTLDSVTMVWGFTRITVQ